MVPLAVPPSAEGLSLRCAWNCGAAECGHIPRKAPKAVRQEMAIS